jgi:hypothetical protein
MFSFALLWLAAASHSKAQDELAALDLDGRPQPATNPPMSGRRKTSEMNLLNLKIS